MKTAIVTVKTEPQVKAQAKKVAEDLGFNLSVLLDAYLRDLVRNKVIHFSMYEEVPNERVLQALREADEDRKKGNVLSFENPQDAIAYVENMIKEEEYEN